MYSDRTLPSCATCLKSGQSCEYPTSAQKPGPKTGKQNLSRSRLLLTFNHAQYHIIVFTKMYAEFAVGMCHRSKKRKPSEPAVTGHQSSSSQGITRYNSNTSNHPVSSTSDPPGSYRHQLGSSQSSQLGYHSSSNFAKDIAGLPSPVPTVATTRSSVSSESKNNTLSQIIHPSHEPTMKTSASWNQSELTAVEDKSASTKRIIEGVCETLHISANLYSYL